MGVVAGGQLCTTVDVHILFYRLRDAYFHFFRSSWSDAGPLVFLFLSLSLSLCVSAGCQVSGGQVQNDQQASTRLPLGLCVLHSEASQVMLLTLTYTHIHASYIHTERAVIDRSEVTERDFQTRDFQTVEMCANILVVVSGVATS